MLDMRQGSCPLCRHNEIVQCAPLEWSYAGAVVMAAAHEKDRLGNFNPQKPIGAFNLWLCRRCGYTQWFAFEPERIPIGPEHGTRLIKGSEPGGPFR